MSLTLTAEPSFLRAHLARMQALAVPIAIGQMGQMAMVLIDMYMVGKLGPAAISGVGLGGAICYVFALLSVGTLFGLDTVVSHALGRKDTDACHHWLWQGLWLSLLMSVPLVLLAGWVCPLFVTALFEPAVAEPANAFLRPLSFSLPPFLVFVAVRQYLQAMGSARPGTVVTMLALVFNVGFNWLFIFGPGPFPALGVAGAGLATTATRIWMALVLFVYADRRDQRLSLGLRQSSRAFVPDAVGRLFALGAPIGAQLALEVGAFSLTTAFVSRIGVVPAAAHTIVMNVASFTYTLPIGLAGATALLVGQAIGSGRSAEARSGGWISIGLTVLVQGGSGLLLALFGDRLAAFFTDDADVIRLASRLILVAAFFQVADGLQSVAGGALRGLGSTRPSLVANLVGYWAIGLPFGYWLCFSRDLGAVGCWIGLATGLCVVAIFMTGLWHHETREQKGLDADAS